MKKIVVLFAFVLAFVGMKAQTVSVDEAKSKALALVKKSRKLAPGKVVVEAAPELVYTKVEKSAPLFYVFNYPNGGFAIIGGDECANEVLGYSENGAFDMDSIPEGLRYMLDLYSQQIALAKESGNALRKAASVGRAVIPDLISTKWNQDSPYNNKIPTLGSGYASFVTGCNATATAQVMKFYNYPTKGVGSNSFTINYSAGGTTIPVTFQADFANTTYDWDNMIDDYSGSYTTAQANAVATLMYHVGVGMNMSYNSAGSGGSGSSTTAPGTTLINNFKYSKGTKFERHEYYTDDEWEELIYNELKAGRPILYSGQSGKSGHAFICHGYDASKGGFAFNWGWGSYCDGYYPLAGTGALQPNGSGIGGAGTGSAYTSSQAAYIGLEPDRDGTSVVTPQIALNYEISYSDGTYSATIDRSSGDKNLSLGNTSFHNVGLFTSSFANGLMFVDVLRGRTYYTKTSGTYELNSGSYYTSAFYSYSFNSNVIPYNGTYKIYPVVRNSSSTSDDDWQLVYLPTSYTIPQITIENGKNAEPEDIAFTISDTEVEVSRTAKIAPNKTYNGTMTCTSSDNSIATVTNDGTITGVKVGQAIITVEGSATAEFKKTTRQFAVTVVEKKLRVVELQISYTDLTVGETSAITSNEEYDGTITYASSDESVATVSANGVITAKKEGTATIIATASETFDYAKTIKAFTVKVKGKAAALATGATLVEQPYMKNGNNVTASDIDICITIMNNTSETAQTLCYYRIQTDRYIRSGSYGYSSLSAGRIASFTLSFNDVASEFTAGKQYTVNFYQDKEKTIPMNYPSLTFTFCNSTSITYTQPETAYGTLILPFDADVPVGLNVYECSAYANGNAILDKAWNIKRNTPYVVAGTAGTYSFAGPEIPNLNDTYTNGLLSGVLDNNHLYQPTDYVVAKRNGRSVFAPIGSASAIPQYTAYLTPGSAANGQTLKLPLLDGEVEVVVVPGDFDNDGDVDKEDVSKLCDYLLGTSAVAGPGSGADIDGDGDVDIMDLVRLIEILNSK